jgi:glycosyltransferase involved in cell wall biosynthesis
VKQASIEGGPRQGSVSTETARVAGLMGVGPVPAGTEARSATGRGEPATPRRVTSLTIVVPAKNERATIATVVDRIRDRLSAVEGLRFEILVVDDGSDDGTGSLATERGARVVRHAQSLGNGAAVKRGIREATHDWILLMDADGQHPPEVIPSLIERAEEHDMVVASRNGSGGAWYRNFANRIYNALASYVTSRRIPDLTSGFRLVRADIAKRLVYLLPNTFSYPTTITLAMLRCGYSVAWEPFQVRPRAGKSHIRLLHDGSRFVLIILKIATFFAPLRVFLPVSLSMGALGMFWYLWTYFHEGRFTNMAALLLTQATVMFALGLISEQVAALRFEHIEERPER